MTATWSNRHSNKVSLHILGNINMGFLHQHNTSTEFFDSSTSSQPSAFARSQFYTVPYSESKGSQAHKSSQIAGNNGKVSKSRSYQTKVLKWSSCITVKNNLLHIFFNNL